MRSTKIGAILLLISVLSLFTSVYAESFGIRYSNKYRILVNIKGLPDGNKVYLIRTIGDSKADTISVAAAANSVVIFVGELELEGEIHFVKIDTSDFKELSGQQTWIRIMLANNQNIEITGDVAAWHAVKITGSQATSFYEKEIKIIADSLKVYAKQMTAASDDSVRYANSKIECENAVLSYLKKISTSYVAPNVMAKLEWVSAEIKEELYKSLAPKVRKSYYGVALRKVIDRSYKREQIKEGGLIPDFTLITLDSQYVSIKDFVAKNKVTLVDFWASWCKPCRSQIPHLTEIYNKYKDRGFNIIGISIDHRFPDWAAAVKEDKTPWLHFIQGNIKVDKEIFGLQAIPGYLLVDGEGKMLAFSRGLGSVPSFGPQLRGEVLSETIQKILDRSLELSSARDR